MKKENFLLSYGPWGLVTGASDGIGKNLALEFAKLGLKLILVARRKEELEKLSKKIQMDYGLESKIIPLDLSLPSSNQTLFQEIADFKIGLFAGVAGFGSVGEFADEPLSNQLSMLDLNCRSVLEQTHYFAQKFKAQKRGGIILFSSILGFQGAPFSANYSATKAYIQSLAEALHFECKPYGVAVLSVAPGPVRTHFFKRAHMKEQMADSPQVVARDIVSALGSKITLRPGFLGKFLGWSLLILPRFFRILVLKKIMQGSMEKQ